MTAEECQAAARYWEEKDAAGVKLEHDTLRTMAETYIQSHNTCALATGTGDYVRCTPIEYGWHDSCFWMFSEGGKKFIGLEKNPHVCLAIFDRYEGVWNAPWNAGHGVGGAGGSRSAKHTMPRRMEEHSPGKRCATLSSPMHLICVRPPASTVCFPTSRIWAVPRGRLCCWTKRSGNNFQEAQREPFQRGASGSKTTDRIHPAQAAGNDQDPGGKRSCPLQISDHSGQTPYPGLYHRPFSH